MRRWLHAPDGRADKAHYHYHSGRSVTGNKPYRATYAYAEQHRHVWRGRSSLPQTSYHPGGIRYQSPKGFTPKREPEKWTPAWWWKEIKTWLK